MMRRYSDIPKAGIPGVIPFIAIPVTIFVIIEAAENAISYLAVIEIVVMIGVPAVEVVMDANLTELGFV